MSNTSVDIFGRVLGTAGEWPPEVAKFILDLNFTPEDHARYEVLAGKASEGALTPEETDEIDAFLHVDSLLSIMQSQARQALNRNRSAKQPSVLGGFLFANPRR